MKRHAVITTVLILLFSTTALGQDRLELQFEEAWAAWGEGQYILSMELLLEILESPGGDRLLPLIAQVSGTPFQVTELTTDGSQINLSPDGEFASWTETLNGRSRTRVTPIPNEAGIEIHGYGSSGLVFSPIHGQAAYFMVEENRDLSRAREELAGIDRANNRQAWVEASQRVRSLEEELRTIWVWDYSTLDAVMELAEDGIRIRSFAFSPDGVTLFAVATVSDMPVSNGIYGYRVEPSRRPVAPELLTSEDGTISNLIPVAGGKYLVYTVTVRGTPPSGGQRQQGRSPTTGTICLMDLDSGEVRRFEGSEAVVSADGSMLVVSVGRRWPAEDDDHLGHDPLPGHFSRWRAPRLPDDARQGLGGVRTSAHRRYGSDPGHPQPPARHQSRLPG